MAMINETNQLRRLARLYGVQESYYNLFGESIKPPREALLSVLRMLGAPVEKNSDLAGAVREREHALFQQVLEPVNVVWEGETGALKLRAPVALAQVQIHCTIVLEGGETTVECSLRDDPTAKKPAERLIDGVAYVTRSVKLSVALPLGYHRMHVRIGAHSSDHFLFVAPPRAFGAARSRKKSWGVFCPLYALHSAKSWGVGDFSDLHRLMEFVGGLGGDAVGTLPLFAAFLDEPFNPSPYAPVSRLFWNELFLDIDAIEELPRCVGARSIIHSAGFETEMEKLRVGPLVDYRRVMLLKRKVLNELLRCLLKRSSRRRSEFERFVATHPLAQDYAAFRAKTDGERKPWQLWHDSSSRDGTLRVGDYVEQVKQYHLFVQWLAELQVRALDAKSQGGGPSLYLDFPLGVNRDGYDVWRERQVFALQASGGAPPDDFFIKGQDWGFPPLHPEGLRRQGYRYYIQCVQRHLEHAKMLRIDHVMGLYRFYWVPEGFAPSEGVYVRYHAAEFFAVLNLESQRHQVQIVGENLGTVPPAVNAAMAKYGIHGMHVGQFGVTADPERALDSAPLDAVASLNTHDTPTFAGFWRGDDIDDRRALELLTEEAATEERARREQQKAALTGFLKKRGLLGDEAADAAAVLKAWLSHLASGDSDFLLINLEDLWLEAAPQNVPGTWEERPNWMRKARYSMEQLREMPALRETLTELNENRNSGR